MPATADLQSLLQCRRLPAGEARAECLERESARLERELTVPGAAAGSAAPSVTSAPSPPRATTASVGKELSAIGVRKLSYVDGMPRFELENGERWQSSARRTLTSRPDGDYVRLQRSPFGMQLHFNGSLFALPVQQVD